MNEKFASKTSNKQKNQKPQISPLKMKKRSQLANTKLMEFTIKQDNPIMEIEKVQPFVTKAEDSPPMNNTQIEEVKNISPIKNRLKFIEKCKKFDAYQLGSMDEYH